MVAYSNTYHLMATLKENNAMAVASPQSSKLHLCSAQYFLYFKLVLQRINRMFVQFYSTVSPGT